jgi:hypothetical protein
MSHNYEAGTRRAILAIELGERSENIDFCDYDHTLFRIGRQEWMVLTDDEADTVAGDSIRDLTETELDSIPEHLRQYVDIDSYVEDIIRMDGRGPHLASWDGEEREVYVPKFNEYFYIYRTN